MTTSLEQQLRDLWDEAPAGEEARAAALAAFGGVPPLRTRRRRRLAVAAGLLVAVTAGAGSTAAAAQDALPGDTTYGVKLTIERAQVALARGDAAEATAWLAIAQNRVDEAVQAGSEGRYDVLPEVADRYRDAVAQARSELARLPGEEPLVATAEEELNRHEEVLAGLVQVVPEQARAALQQALETASRGGPPAQLPPVGPPPRIERAPQAPAAPGAPPTDRPGPASPGPGDRAPDGAGAPGSRPGGADDRPGPPAQGRPSTTQGQQDPRQSDDSQAGSGQQGPPDAVPTSGVTPAVPDAGKQNPKSGGDDPYP